MKKMGLLCSNGARDWRPMSASEFTIQNLIFKVISGLEWIRGGSLRSVAGYIFILRRFDVRGVSCLDGSIGVVLALVWLDRFAVVALGAMT